MIWGVLQACTWGEYVEGRWRKRDNIEVRLINDRTTETKTRRYMQREREGERTQKETKTEWTTLVLVTGSYRWALSFDLRCALEQQLLASNT